MRQIKICTSGQCFNGSLLVTFGKKTTVNYADVYCSGNHVYMGLILLPPFLFSQR